MKNKKLIASLTLAGFMAAGIVPSAGLLDVAPIYAADVPSVSASYVETDDSNPEVDTNEAVEVKIGLLDKDAVATTGTGKIYVWVEKNNNVVDDALSLANPVLGVSEINGKGILVFTPSSVAETKLNVKFARAGKYTLHAAYIEEAGTQAEIQDAKITAAVEARELARNSDKGVITVSAKTNVKSFRIGTEIIETDHTATTTATLNNTNGIKKGKIKVTAFKNEAATESVGRGLPVKIDTNSNNIQLVKKTDVTDNSGSVEIEFTATAQGDYKIFVDVDGNEITVPVKVTSSNVDKMVVVKTPTAPIATDAVENVSLLHDFVRIEFRDPNGALLKTVSQEVTNGNKDYVKVVEKPARSRVEAKDFRIVPVSGKDYYTIRSAKTLVEGKYVLRFATDNGKTIDVSFEVAPFGVAKSLKLEYDTETVGLGKEMPAADIYFLDDKGVKKAAKGVNLGYNGYAVKKFEFADGSFSVKDDEKYLGTKITVTAVAERQNLVSIAEINVAQDGRGLKFATNSGVINTNNQVDFTVIDGAGKSVSIVPATTTTPGSTPTAPVRSVNAIVLSSSNKEAKVSANFSTGDVDAAKGTGKLFVTSDKPTTAEIQVFIRDANNQYYASTLTYTFSETGKNANINRFVVMSIGSNMANVNNSNVSLEAAPIVKSNRTFVPLRVIAEAFGAEVGYDEKTKKVTVKSEGNTLELTQDDKKLMINDKEKVMDVAPFVSNARVMVPVRFVAEELGFKVTAIRDAQRGGTSSVVFSR